MNGSWTSTWPTGAVLADEMEPQPRRLADAQVPATMLEFLEGGLSTMAAARRAFDNVVNRGSAVTGPDGEIIVYEMGQVRLTAPLTNPPSLRDFIAFEDHIAATSKKRGQPIPPEWYKAPVYYKGNHRTIIGPDQALSWPLNTTKLDYELELACVIGRKGSRCRGTRCPGLYCRLHDHERLQCERHSVSGDGLPARPGEGERISPPPSGLAL